MSWKLRVLVPAILAAPQAAFALGLGDIRLNSALNEPLSAEIDLVAAAPDEIDAVRAQLASRELFDRYGLDRATYLDSVTFRVGKGRDGRSVLLVRSAAPIGEPFVTFLVEVNWPRGKLLREYTVLLDPPVFAPAEPSRAPVAAPRVVSQMPAASVAAAPASAPPMGEAPVSAPAASVAEPSAVSRVERPSSYRVERNDTLYQIAAGLSDGSRRETQRMVIALFRTNPGAFDGNINRLRQGEVLRVPGVDEVAAISSGDAAREISRQMTEWRGSAPAAESGRLKLVTPEEGTAAAGTSVVSADRETRARVQQLEQELAESRRLLELKSTELAALQRKLEGTAAPAGTEAPAVPDVAATETPPATEATAPAAEPAVAPPVSKKVTRKQTKPASAVAEPSLVDRLTDHWGYMVGAAGVVLVGLLGFGFLRRRREDEFDDAVATAGASAQAYRAAPAMRGPGVERPEAIVVEEERVAAEAVTARSGGRLEDTFSSESAVNIDHADPLAEADFHMAYGLHDQAADLIKLALQKEPQRRDLKNKLLEVYFVWGNKESFLEVARDLQATRQDAPPGEWERVVIMGRQIAPEHALFAGTVSSAAMGAMDVNLEGGQTRIDLELLAPPPAEAGVDLDLGRAMGEGTSGGDTGRSEMLDLDLGMPPPAVSPTAELPTLEMPQPSERTAELPTVEMPTGDAGTTAEQPRFEGAGETVRQRFEAPPVPGPAVDATAELSVDDLGIDLGELEALASTSETPVPDIEDTSTMLTQFSEEEDATRLAPHILQHPEARASGAAGDEHDAGGTEVLPQLLADGEDLLAEATEIAPVADLTAAELTHALETTAEKPTLDLDLGDATIAEPVDFAPTTRLNVTALDQGHTARIDVTEMPQLSELEPVTLSEVGTKLDLARAYMDMGDPDGARSILQEVLAEGSASQKQEAQRLIDALPGVA